MNLFKFQINRNIFTMWKLKEKNFNMWYKCTTLWNEGSHWASSITYWKISPFSHIENFFLQLSHCENVPPKIGMHIENEKNSFISIFCLLCLLLNLSSTHVYVYWILTFFFNNLGNVKRCWCWWFNFSVISS